MDYDLVIIGAGWAGFNAALKAKESGSRVALVECGDIGGTCLNRGCIPTKALIQSAKVYALAKKSASFGVEAANPRPDFLKIQERKNKITGQLGKGMQLLLGGVDFFKAEAQILSPQQVKAGQEVLSTKSILIATGSKPIELESFKFNAKNILSSDQILNLDHIPASLLVIGGGVIGSEFAGLFSALGTKVTIVEKTEQLLPGEDPELAKKLETVFKKKGIQVNTGRDAAGLDLSSFELVLVCVGRAPSTAGLNLENLKLALDQKGRIVVDDYLKTSIPNIYAAGDCTGKIMLAHFAAYQGKIAALNIARPESPVKANNTAIPNCIFTEPQIASIGLSQARAKEAGLDIAVNKFDFLGSGMARILDETEGFIKIISDKKTGVVLGAAIIGPGACELIAILGLAVSNQLKISQLKNTVFAHPTLSEAIVEALR